MRESTTTMGRPLTSGQAAARLGICAKTLLRAVGRGEITPAYRTPGGFVRFWPDDIEVYARRLSAATGARRAALAAAHGEPCVHEERLRTLVTHLPVILFALDADGMFTLSDGAGLAPLGVAPGQLVGRSYRDVHAAHPEIVEHLRRALAGAEVAFFNRVEGRTLDARATPLRDARGRVTGVIGVSVDITDRVRAEERQARLAALVEASDDAIFGKTLDGRITSWNGGAERLYGYTAAEIVGQSVARFIPPDQPTELGEMMQAVARGETIRQYETARVRKDGTRVAVALTITPIRDRDGAVVSASVVARDITARKEAEEALRASEERLRALTEAAADAIIAADGDGRILSWNAAATRLFGYAKEEVVGRPLTLLMPESYRAAHAQGLRRLTAGGEPRALGHTLELVGRRKDGGSSPSNCPSRPGPRLRAASTAASSATSRRAKRPRRRSPNWPPAWKRRTMPSSARRSTASSPPGTAGPNASTATRPPK